MIYVLFCCSLQFLFHTYNLNIMFCSVLWVMRVILMRVTKTKWDKEWKVWTVKVLEVFLSFYERYFNFMDMSDLGDSWRKSHVGLLFFIFCASFFLKLSNGCLVWFGFVLLLSGRKVGDFFYMCHMVTQLSIETPCALQQTRDVLDY